MFVFRNASGNHHLGLLSVVWDSFKARDGGRSGGRNILLNNQRVLNEVSYCGVTGGGFKALSRLIKNIKFDMVD